MSENRQMSGPASRVLRSKQQSVSEVGQKRSRATGDPRRLRRGDPRKAARARWAKHPTRFDPKPEPEPGALIGPVKADTRHGYVMVKADGPGYYLVHPQAMRRAA